MRSSPRGSARTRARHRHSGGRLTLGSAAPHFFRSLSDLPWRGTMLAAGSRSLAALLLWLCVTEGPDAFPAARFDLRMAGAVFHERGPRLACFGYSRHMWESTPCGRGSASPRASLEARAPQPTWASRAGWQRSWPWASAAHFGAYAGGALADRWGRTTLPWPPWVVRPRPATSVSPSADTRAHLRARAARASRSSRTRGQFSTR